ncbi:ABC transporter substrate-binding protein [Acrocarpospora pleiomorpha]|uniref:ABC transporter substrate-binding protein n=1 Tax=Acrocarpospora pleiomorpha TaxID=90975 RepID=A0A5M3XND5_9ACTN|nr:ABC transporter substrate-binding protein [Acrocarpospora pleiomorpha]GES19708.1 ABC transporter substrate-binding protein [Acrocarpospora pleiomorpha]
MPTSFDPRMSAPLDPIFLDAVYESLINRTPAGELGPGLATEWEFSDDNKVLTFTLRDGVRFHDGEKYDAEAAKASIEAFKKGGTLVGQFAILDKVEVTGPLELKLTFKEPAGYMLNVLAGEAGIAVSPKALDAPDLGTKPVGTGPFTLTALQEGKAGFKKFDGYWNVQAVGIGGMEMIVFNDEPTRLRAVKSGQVDGSSISGKQIKEAEAAGLSIVSGPNTRFMGLLLNTKVKALSNPKVREALLYAIDREAINNGLEAGTCVPTVQPFPQSHWAATPDLKDAKPYYDVAKAKQLLAEAGYPNGFDMEIASGTTTSFQAMAQVLQAQLKQVGINASVQVFEFQQMINARRTGKFTSVVSGIQAGRPDPSQFIADFYLPGGPYNSGGYELPGGKELLAKARASADETERGAAMQEAFNTVIKDGPPVIPICNLTYVAAFRKGVTGWQVPVVGDYDFTSVRVAD